VSTTLPPTVRGKAARLDPLVHVIFALAAIGASLFLAFLTLWPGQALDKIGTPLVHAAESSREAIPTPSQVNSGGKPGDRARTPIASLNEQEPPQLLAEEAGLKGLLTCSVVDEAWNPVDSAEIWVNDGEWRLAGECNSKGNLQLRFDPDLWIRHFHEGHDVVLGARGKRHGPSLETRLRAIPSEDLVLVLRGQGASMRIDVIDPRGLPVPTAQIRFEDHVEPDAPGSLAVLVRDGLHAIPTRPPVALTNHWGSVTFEGLEAGSRFFTVTAEGYRPRKVRVELYPGEPRIERVELVPLADLQGIALNAAGRSLPGTTVFATELDGSAVFSASCSADGYFEFLELPATTLRLAAVTREGTTITQEARTTITLQPGETGHWNPTLRPVEMFSGSLADHWGQPLAGWQVELEIEGESPRTTITDENGEYLIPTPPNLEVGDLAFFHPFALGSIPTKRVDLPDRDRWRELRDVQLDEEDENSSSIRGRILGSDGAPLHHAPLVIRRLEDQSSFGLQADPVTGRFESPALPPGNYLIRFPRHGRGWAIDERLTLDGHRPLDLGTIELPELGQLQLLTSGSLRREDCVDVFIELVRPGIDYNFGLPVLLGRVEIPIQLDFAPGHYRLHFPEDGDQRWIQLEIESGQTTSFEVPGTD
jgi:hypothetical protein